MRDSLNRLPRVLYRSIIGEIYSWHICQVAISVGRVITLTASTWCLPSSCSKSVGAESRWSVKMKWYGHACFTKEGSGISIVTDPYAPEVAGLNPMEEPGDVANRSGYRTTLGPHSYR